jgi:hypothetical protein
MKEMIQNTLRHTTISFSIDAATIAGVDIRRRRSRLLYIAAGGRRARQVVAQSLQRVQGAGC